VAAKGQKAQKGASSTRAQGAVTVYAIHPRRSALTQPARQIHDAGLTADGAAARATATAGVGCATGCYRRSCAVCARVRRVRPTRASRCRLNPICKTCDADAAYAVWHAASPAHRHSRPQRRASRAAAAVAVVGWGRPLLPAAAWWRWMAMRRCTSNSCRPSAIPPPRSRRCRYPAPFFFSNPGAFI